MRVVHERACGGRLFQTVGAAARKAREPNDKLDRATDKTLAETDPKALHAWIVAMKQAGTVAGGCGYFNLIRASMGRMESLVEWMNWSQ